MHIALLGDSILDNASYVGNSRGLSVIEHLKRECVDDVGATLLARDGAVVASMDKQIDMLTSDMTHVVVSVGGNDALAASRILSRRVPNVATAFYTMAPVQKNFVSSYKRMCRRLDDTGKNVLLCAIYNPCNLPNQKILQEIEVAALSLFNDVIYRVANEFGFPVLDLRRVCTQRSDYFNSIEPNHQGGGKIVDAILNRTTLDGFLFKEDEERAEDGWHD
jgi:hypothetical protein